MDLVTFQKLISLMEKIDKRRSAADEIGIDMSEYDDPHMEAIFLLVKSLFGESGEESISWFCYENDYGRDKLEAWDKDGNPICRNVKELWQCVTTSPGSE